MMLWREGSDSGQWAERIIMSVCEWVERVCVKQTALSNSMLTEADFKNLLLSVTFSLKWCNIFLNKSILLVQLSSITVPANCLYIAYLSHEHTQWSLHIDSAIRKEDITYNPLIKQAAKRPYGQSVLLIWHMVIKQCYLFSCDYTIKIKILGITQTKSDLQLRLVMSGDLLWRLLS
jgi:hypothetical protein